jgi:hypothetical protein
MLFGKPEGKGLFGRKNADKWIILQASLKKLDTKEHWN